jgi:hypothetical protein
MRRATGPRNLCSAWSKKKRRYKVFANSLATIEREYDDVGIVRQVGEECRTFESISAILIAYLVKAFQESEYVR